MAVDLTDLLCALATQGGITLLGYFSGVIGLIGRGRSISVFVSRIALPCLLLRAVANAPLGSLNVCFLLLMLLSKFTIMVLGAGVGARLLSGTRLKSAAIGGLVSTCSNDLAFGMPILKAINPQMSIYLVLVAMMQNALLNPLCFVLMEAGQASEKAEGTKLDVLKSVAKGVAKNALVIAPIIGLLANAMTGGQLPLAIDRLLETIGDAFLCTSLFSLGLSLATPPPQAPGLEMPAGRVWAVILSLSVLKLILLPVIASQLVSAVGCAGAEGDAGAFADVAYIYGSLPPAPWISAFATINQHHGRVIAHTLALTLIAAFPLLLSGSLTLTTENEGNEDAAVIFSSVCHSLSIVGTALLLLPLAASAALRAIASRQRVPSRQLVSMNAWLSSRLSEHLHLSPSVLLLTWLQFSFSLAAILGRGGDAWTGERIDISQSGASAFWYIVTNTCRLAAAAACVAVVRASSRRKQASSIADRKRLLRISSVGLLALVLTLPFALNPATGSGMEALFYVQGGTGQLVVDLLYDLCLGVVLLLMARRLFAELMRGSARVGEGTMVHSSSSVSMSSDSRDTSVHGSESGGGGGGGLSHVQSVIATPLTSRALMLMPPSPMAASDGAAAGGGGGSSSPEEGGAGGAALPPKGWREVAIAMAAALRVSLDVVIIAAELSMGDQAHSSEAAPAAAPAAAPGGGVSDVNNATGGGDASSTMFGGRALLVMRLLSVALTDGQGFFTFVIFFPRVALTAAVSGAARSSLRRIGSTPSLADLSIPLSLSLDSLPSLPSMPRARSETSLARLDERHQQQRPIGGGALRPLHATTSSTTTASVSAC